jgi:hypothetical protein
MYKEVGRLQQKVAWFASNQPLIAQLQEQLRLGQQALGVIDELVAKKDVAAIHRIVSSTKAKMMITSPSSQQLRQRSADAQIDSYHEDDVMNNSFATVSSSPTATKSGGRRSLADIKKIKLLEQQVRPSIGF